MVCDNYAIKNLSEALTVEGALFLIDTQMTRFRSPLLAEALAFWTRKAKPDLLPSRREFTPPNMRTFLSKVALFEFVKQQDGAFRIRARLTGPEFSRVFSEMSRKYVDEVVPQNFYRRWVLMFDAAHAYGRPFRVVFVPAAFGREHSVVELLLAPLVDEAGEQNQFVVTLNFEFGASWSAVYAEEAKHLI